MACHRHIGAGKPLRTPGEKPMKQEQSTETKQLLHLVFGGELTDLEGIEFADLENLDIVGIFPDYASAHNAWIGAAQRTVDNAHIRYFIVHMHRLLDPKTDTTD
jgi:hypothetical protein